MKEERLYIVGYMASGKTTFGRALASDLGWDFIDLDEEIERSEGRSVARIIEEEGVAAFREKESKALKSTAALKHTVIACGGGTPCFFDNMEFMTLHGMSLWLLASPERIAERIIAAGPTRPLVAGMERDALVAHVKRHLLQRQPYYARANWRLSGERLEDEAQIADTVAAFRHSFL